MAPQAKTPEELRAEQMARSQAANEDIEAREGAENDPLIERGATDDIDHGAGDPADTGVVRREPIQRSPQDDTRSKIAARFRRTEPDGERPFNGDFADSENIVGRIAQPADDDDTDDDLADLGLSEEEIARARGKRAQTSEDDDGDVDDQPVVRRTEQPAQRTHKLKVNGKIVELTDEQVLARASKVEAADSYLEEAKALLREAKAIRSGRTASHSGENGADTADLGTDAPELEVQNPEPTTRSVIEKIQFGDPDEAAAELDRLVDSRAGKKATEGQLDRVIKQDLSRSQKHLKEFSEAHPELKNNRLAALAIEDGMYQGYAEDMLKLGLSEEQLPTDTKTLAQWHRFYRVNGYDVRSTKDLLDASHKGFLQSIGQLGGRRQQQQPSRQQQPRVQVNVDRDQRRMAIPTQPTRSVAPRRDVQPSQRPRTGSDVVNQMRRQRGQPVI